MDGKEAIAAWKAARDAWQTATAAEREARKVSYEAQQAMQAALIEEHGFRVGQELPGENGPQWIAHISFDQYNQELYAACVYTLKSGKRSKQLSRVVLLSVKDM